jgi:hypothetical protein
VIGARPSGAWAEAPATADVVLVAVALLTAAALAFGRPDAGVAQRVLVDVDGVTLHDVLLDQPQRLIVVGPVGQSVILIDGTRARIASAPCSGQICVARGWLHRIGDVAACVPNRIVLRLTGDAPAALDGITQ